MKNKITQFIPVLVVLLIIGFSSFSQWCAGTGQACFRTVIDRMIPEITYPIYFLSTFFLPIAIVLIFVKRNIFNSWLKFAAWALPLLLILVATQPVVSGFMSTNRDDAARLAGQVFSAVSLVLIIWKYFASRRATH